MRNLFLLALLLIVGCDQLHPSPPTLKNGQRVLVKISSTVATVEKRIRTSTSDGDVYRIRYLSVYGDTEVADLREWELQPLDEIESKPHVAEVETIPAEIINTPIPLPPEEK